MDTAFPMTRPSPRAPVVENRFGRPSNLRFAANTPRQHCNGRVLSTIATPAKQHSLYSPLRITAHTEGKTTVSDDDVQAEVERSAWMILEHYNRCDVQGKPQVRRDIKHAQWTAPHCNASLCKYHMPSRTALHNSRALLFPHFISSHLHSQVSLQSEDGIAALRACIKAAAQATLRDDGCRPILGVCAPSYSSGVSALKQWVAALAERDEEASNER